MLVGGVGVLFSPTEFELEIELVARTLPESAEARAALFFFEQSREATEPMDFTDVSMRDRLNRGPRESGRFSAVAVVCNDSAEGADKVAEF